MPPLKLTFGIILFSESVECLCQLWNKSVLTCVKARTNGGGARRGRQYPLGFNTMYVFGIGE